MKEVDICSVYAVLFQQIYEQYGTSFSGAVCGGVSGYVFVLRAVFTDEKAGA